MRTIPIALLVLRLLAAPAILLLSLTSGGAPYAAALIAVGLASDVFDGIIARRLGVATERLRTSDSFADAWFYGCVASAAWVRAPGAIRECAVPLVLLAAVQVMSCAIDLARYGRIASFHAYSAKVWGLTLAAAGIALVGWRTGGPWLWAMIAAGFLANAEGMAIKLLLRTWQHDVPTVWHAVERRKRGE